MRRRYGRRADKQRITEWMQTHNTNVFDDAYLETSYNIAPQSYQPVVRLDSETGQRELTVMRWGLVPFWAKDAKIGYSTINAKAETITTSPTFREPMKRRRCLVPADWFYEWQKIDANTKQPYAIALKDGESTLNKKRRNPTVFSLGSRECSREELKKCSIEFLSG